MKTCTLCKTEKALDQFNKHSKLPDGKQNVCRECNRARSRKYYADNLEQHRKVTAARSKQQRDALRTFVNAEKSKPCTDCGQTFIPFAMDFDHITDDKRADISRLVRSGTSLETVQAEIAKCELVCATCHRIRTWKRMVS